MNTDDDVLLGALDQLTNIIYWHHRHGAVTAVNAVAEALDDWLAEHAAEHHQSEPFADDDDPDDPLGTVFAHLAAAVTDLTGRKVRPGLTVTEAFTEALVEGVAATAAEHNHSEPLQRAP